MATPPRVRAANVGGVMRAEGRTPFQRAVARAIERFGKLDCAIGNAGIWDYSLSLDAIPDERVDAAFDEMFHINVKGYLLLAKAALPSLAASGGSIIYTVSNAGFDPAGGGPLYTAAKHAVVGMSRTAAVDYARKGCLLYTSPSPRDRTRSRMPSSA